MGSGMPNQVISPSATTGPPVPTIQQWANDLIGSVNTILASQGKTAVPLTNNNVTALEVWAQAEGGSTANSAAWNVLNTTQPGFGLYQNNGLPAYPDYESGLQATATTLTQSQYAPIIASLQASSAPSVTLSAVQSSPWAASQYGGKLATSQLNTGTPNTILNTSPLIGAPPVTGATSTTGAGSTTGAVSTGLPAGNILVAYDGMLKNQGGITDIPGLINMVFVRGSTTGIGLIILLAGLAIAISPAILDTFAGRLGIGGKVVAGAAKAVEHSTKKEAV